MKDSIILIGFMGAGKTSVGKAAARLAGLPFLDTDREIERRAGMKIPEIFAQKGEAAFREAETDLLRRLREEEGAVISCGGGMPLREENARLLSDLGTVVYLRVRPETVELRLRGDTSRPLLAEGDAGERIRYLMAAREPFYRRAADLTVDTDGLSVLAVAEKIIFAVKNA